MISQTIKPRGIGAIIFYVIFAMGVLVCYVFVVDIYVKGFLISDMIGLLFGAYFMFSAARYTLFNRITTTRTNLIIDQIELGAPKNVFIPRHIQINLKLENIDGVIITALKNLTERQSELKSKALDETVNFWHQWFISPKNVMPYPMWLGAKYSTVMYIHEKSGASHVVPTKLYSKKSFVGLVQALREANIPVATE